MEGGDFPWFTKPSPAIHTSIQTLTFHPCPLPLLTLSQVLRHAASFPLSRVVRDGIDLARCEKRNKNLQTIHKE